MSEWRIAYAQLVQECKRLDHCIESLYVYTREVENPNRYLKQMLTRRNTTVAFLVKVDLKRSRLAP